MAFTVVVINVGTAPTTRPNLMFATSCQLELLVLAKCWYADGIFCLVQAPFTQLFSIHTFVRSGESMKQVCLAFIVMSGKAKADYGADFCCRPMTLSFLPAVYIPSLFATTEATNTPEPFILQMTDYNYKGNDHQQQ